MSNEKITYLNSNESSEKPLKREQSEEEKIERFSQRLYKIIADYERGASALLVGKDPLEPIDQVFIVVDTIQNMTKYCEEEELARLFADLLVGLNQTDAVFSSLVEQPEA